MALSSSFTNINPDQYDSQANSLQNQIQNTQDNAASSPTALSSVATPTNSDLYNQGKEMKLENQLQTIQKKQLTAQWYGNDAPSAGTAPDEGSNPGLIGSALNILQAPLHSVVAGVSSLTGGTPVAGQDFSDLLKSHNVPYPIAAPLGFAADVALDPVNWLTGGADALIPRAAVGLAKGGAEGLAEGVKSSLLQKASGVAGMLPGVAKFGDEGYANTFAGQLSKNADASYQNYKTITGYDPLKNITQAGVTLPGQSSRTNLMDVTRGIASFIPGGDKIYQSLYYSSRDWLDNQIYLDAINGGAAKTVGDITAPSVKGAALSDLPIDGKDALQNPLIKPNLDILKNVPLGQERNALVDDLNKSAQDISFMDAHPAAVTSTNPEQSAWRVLQEATATDQLRQKMAPLIQDWNASGANDATGIKPYDDAVNWAKNLKVNIGSAEVQPLKQLLDGYNALIQGVFKPAHTILSPTTWAMNVLSAPVMYMMMGGEDVGKMMGYYKDSYKALIGMDPRSFVLNSGFLDPQWTEAMMKTPGVMRKTFGVGPAFFLGRGQMEQMVQAGKEQGLWTAGNEDAALKALTDFSNDLKSKLQQAETESGKPDSVLSRLFSKTRKPGATTAAEEDIGRGMTPSALMEELRATLGREGAPASTDLPAGFTVRDPQAHSAILDKVEAYIKDQASKGSAPAKVYSSFMDKARAGYEHQDQSMRMAISMALTKDGLSEAAIKKMSRFSPFKNPEEDLVSSYVKNGKTYWKLSPMKAIDVANDAAINYGAMPAAIRMLRSVPLVGGPFASFSYGMGLRTAQTLAYNPSLLNKIGFGIQSASGTKTPLERAAMNPPPGQPNYYGWYNSPTMMKLPVNFFDNYPLYLNLTNALPYYTLNIFQPSSRTYQQTLPDDMVAALDSSPLLKDPIGSTLFDYFILPSILSGTGERPMTSSGSPLYPIGATPAQQAFYGGRTLADEITPPILSPAGLVAPESVAQDLPGYRTRQLVEGRAGKSALGIPGSESPSSRTIRNVLGLMGLPVEKLDTSYTASQYGGPSGGS